jgi:serine/threonine protein kinase
VEERIGQQLGSYRLVHLLGQGGFADVYLGEHIHLQTLAAVKVLQMRLVGSNLEQFRNEARTIASLIHPHIVRVLDFGVEDGIPFLVMEYAPHGTLRQAYPEGTQQKVDTSGYQA